MKFGFGHLIFPSIIQCVLAIIIYTVSHSVRLTMPTCHCLTLTLTFCSQPQAEVGKFFLLCLAAYDMILLRF